MSLSHFIVKNDNIKTFMFFSVILYYLHSQRVARRQQVEALTIKLKHMQKTNQLLKGASNKITFATGTILTRRRSSLLSRNASLRQNQ